MKNSRSFILTFRCTVDERKQIADKAASCGLSISEYVRQCAIGNKPKLRMTETEIVAFNSLAEARGELVRIKNALRGKSQEQRKRYFNDTSFMRYWIIAVDKLIRNWYDTLNRLAK
jgi:hypothetical protein